MFELKFLCAIFKINFIDSRSFKFKAGLSRKCTELLYRPCPQQAQPLLLPTSPTKGYVDHSP